MHQQDMKGYVALLRDSLKRFLAERIKISVALHPGMYLPKKLYSFIDRVNLMSYDFDLQRGENYHADSRRVIMAAKSFLDMGCPAEKLLLGLPLYARYSQNPGDVKTIAEIVDGAKSPKVVLESSSGSYMGYFFESQNDLEQKVTFVQGSGGHRLGGIFFWEIGQDKPDDKLGQGGILMTSVARKLRNHNINDEL